MLPIPSDFAPMEAQLVDTMPDDAGWQYEPKWDGFRCLVFRNGDNLEMRSKSGQPLDRYFPEVVHALMSLDATTFVLDGELLINDGDQFSFDQLLERIHPAATRIKKLSVDTPATLVLFDLLVDDRGHNLTEAPLEERRVALEKFAHKFIAGQKRIVLSPAVTDFASAEKWWQLVGEGLDGIVAKRLGIPYQSGNRKGMLKIKKIRTADCVIGGFRYAEKAPVVGSLLLGLYNDEGLLDHVGFTSAFKANERKELLKLLKPVMGGSGFTGNKPGGPSRWSTKRSMEWVPLEPLLVVEVQYDHFTDRFRHGTKLLRWRPDKAPEQCTYDQVKRATKGTARLLKRVS